MTSDKPLKSSTAQVKVTPFAPHGQVDIWIDGNLHHYEATGPFNKELVECLAVAQSNFLQALKPAAPWVSICTVKENALATPDGLQRYAELIRKTPSNLIPAATAYVIGPEVEGGQFMVTHFTKIFADVGRPFQTFETMAEAQNWAQTMIDKAKAS
jgi:hypothetical protein